MSIAFGSLPGFRLGRDTVYNLAGSVLPLAVSLVTVPLYLLYMGAADYGVLAIAWVILGYFGLFNLNFDRVATHFIARESGAADHGRLFWTLLAASLVAGCVGGGLLFGGFWLVASLKPTWLAGWGWARMAPVAGWLAAAVPVTTVSTTVQGALDGARRFLLNNVLKLTGSTLLQLAPVIAAFRHGHDLAIVIGVAVCAKAVVIPVFLLAGARSLKAGFPQRPHLGILREGLGFGGWYSLQSALYQVGTTLDQIMIGMVLGPAAVTYYSVPYRFTSRISVLPGALTGALFPRLSAADDATAERLGCSAMLVLAGISLPLIAIAMLLAHSFFSLWLGAGISGLMVPTAIILLLGAWINGVSYIPANLLVSRGRVKLGAGIHALVTSGFLIVLWLMLRLYGVEGAAWAWALRALGGLLGFSLPFASLLRTLVILLPICAGLVGLAWLEINQPVLGGWYAVVLAVTLSTCGLTLARRAVKQYTTPVAALVPAAAVLE